MTHEQLMAFSKYQNGRPQSQEMARQLAMHITNRYQMTPHATKNDFLQYPTNFLLIETIDSTKDSIVIDVNGDPANYQDLARNGVHITAGQNGITRLRITDPLAIPNVLRAVDRSWDRVNGPGGSEEVLNYWITTHWPLPKDGRQPFQRDIYLQEGDQEVARELLPGDRVLIYESQSGKRQVETLPDGSTKPVPRKRGRGGIVVIAEVAMPLKRQQRADAEKLYDHGSKMNWAWKSETRNHVTYGFVPRAQVCKVLNYDEDFNFHGFGDKNSGLKRISKEQFSRLVELYLQNEERVAVAPGGREPSAGHPTEGGGEGADHLLLKEYVADDPSAALGETGVRCHGVEYPFPSRDRADIVLKDAMGRFIGVEIEIQQTADQLEGLLQAVKYRHMVAVTEGVSFEETRSLLVAYDIAPEILALCKRYNVQVKQPTRAAVLAWKITRDSAIAAKNKSSAFLPASASATVG